MGPLMASVSPGLSLSCTYLLMTPFSYLLISNTSSLALMIWARNGHVCANGQIALIIHGCALTALGRAHDDDRGNGRERRATVGQLKCEARGIVIVGLDGFEIDIEEIVGVQRGYFLGFVFGLEVEENGAGEPPR